MFIKFLWDFVNIVNTCLYFDEKSYVYEKNLSNFSLHVKLERVFIFINYIDGVLSIENFD